MNPSAAWSILTARSPALPRMPRGFGGLGREDVAHMLADLPTESFMMGMAYECNDRGALLDLELRLWQITLKRARDEKWRHPSQPFICRRLAGLALFETLDPLLCGICNGKGTISFSLSDHPEWMLSPHFGRINEQSGHMRCFCCAGTGKLKMSGRKRADLAGVHKFTWANYWSARYEPIFRTTKSWLFEARSHLARKLSENAEA